MKTKMFLQALFFLLFSTCVEWVEAANMSIEIDLNKNRVRLYKGNEEVMNIPCSPGAKGYDDYPYRCKLTVLASSGNDRVSEYSEEYDCWMKYFMRLDAKDSKGKERGVGLHASHGKYIPPWAVSHGCIRLELNDAKKLYEVIKNSIGMKPNIPVTFINGSQMDLKEPLPLK